MVDFLTGTLKYKRKILVVDDDEVNRFMLKDMLEDDYDILLASNGREGLEMLRENSTSLSIVLLDLIMPEMDGYAFMKEVEKDDRLSRIPVIVLTSESSAEVISLRMGAADFLSKPYSEPDVIKARLEKTIRLYERNINNHYENPSANDNTTDEKKAYENRLIADMDKALAEKQFIVFYQPKYAIKTEKPYLCSAEALIRWKHPEFGMVSPGVFIPLFERNGRIIELDHYVWRAAAEQISEWKTGYGVTVPVSVNVSRMDILDERFVEKIENIVSETGVSPKEYLLEITESAFIEDSGLINKKIERLRELGFQIAMDDFGTGYSSLNMISSMPIDILKLDRGFVRNIHDNPKNYRMVEIVMDIAKLLDVKVVAEGVETEAQHELLKKVGVDIIQGFFYSKPVPPEEFEIFLTA